MKIIINEKPYNIIYNLLSLPIYESKIEENYISELKYYTY